MKLMTSVHEKELQAIFGESRVLLEESDRLSYSFDASFGTYMPDAVVQPRSTEEVAKVMQLANREGIPVYPRGQSTSLSGGPAPVRRNCAGLLPMERYARNLS